jgi:hypothetical protein
MVIGQHDVKVCKLCCSPFYGHALAQFLCRFLLGNCWILRFSYHTVLCVMLGTAKGSPEGPPEGCRVRRAVYGRSRRCRSLVSARSLPRWGGLCRAITRGEPSMGSKYNKTIVTSTYFCPGGGSEFEAYPFLSSRLGSSSLSTSIFLGHPICRNSLGS